MKRVASSLFSGLVALLVAYTGQVGAITDPAHGYFNALVAGSAHWKSYSLRSQAEIDQYSNSSSGNRWVTYDATYEAAKVVIPSFIDIGVSLTAAVDATQTTLPLSAVVSAHANGGAIKLGSEILRITRPSGTSNLTFQRGQYGTTAQAHPAGTRALNATNSLQTQVRLPLGTQDGHVYFFTWEGLWTDTYFKTGEMGSKTFQFSVGPKQQIWLEPSTRFAVVGGSNPVPGFDPSRDIAVIEARTYLGLGGPEPYTPAAEGLVGQSMPKVDPMRPVNGHFIVKPNTWVRFFVRIESNASDYDWMDMWAADATQGPVQIYKRVPLTIKGDKSIDRFWLEFNSSTDRFVRGTERDWISYVRNFVALQDPANVSSLLVRPGATAPQPPPSGSPTLTPPANLRIIR